MLIFGIVANAAAAAAAAASVAVLRRSLCVFCYYKTQPANFIINSHTHSAWASEKERESNGDIICMYTIHTRISHKDRISESIEWVCEAVNGEGPTMCVLVCLCTQESPFRQFHSSLLATHKLNDVPHSHICCVYVDTCYVSRSVRHVLRKQRERKRKGKIKRNKRTHMHFSIPFLRCPFRRLYILRHGILALYAWYTYTYTLRNESSNRPTIQRDRVQEGHQVYGEWEREWASKRIGRHMSSGKRTTRNGRARAHTYTRRMQRNTIHSPYRQKIAEPSLFIMRKSPHTRDATTKYSK